MIELTLVFLLGMLVAGLIWLILLPAFWRRAVHLTSERIERSLPMSANEILAEQDRLRAEHGVEIARLQHHVERARADVALAKTETGERLKAEALFHDTIATERRRIIALDAELGAMNVELQTRDMRINELSDALQAAQATISGLETQRDALTGRLNTTIDLAESRRQALDEARVIADRAREAHGEEARRSALLRQELQARQGELREAERRLAGLENSAVLTRIRGGEETYQSAATTHRPRQAG